MIDPSPVPVALTKAVGAGDSIVLVIIEGHHEVDLALEALLGITLPRAEKLELRRVAYLLKADILIALGALPESYRTLFEVTNSLRNKVAHNPHHAFSHQDLSTAKAAVLQAVPNYSGDDAPKVDRPAEFFQWLLGCTWVLVEHYQRAALEHMGKWAAVNERLQRWKARRGAERDEFKADPELDARATELAEALRKRLVRAKR